MLCRYWLSVGAQPTDTVQRLLSRAGVLSPSPMLAMGRKGGPQDTPPVDPMTGTQNDIDQSVESGGGKVDDTDDAT